MSADNFLLVRKHNDKYLVTMEFLSDDEPSNIDTPDQRARAMTFGTLDEAEEYCENEYDDEMQFYEYGWTVDV